MTHEHIYFGLEYLEIDALDDIPGPGPAATVEPEQDLHVVAHEHIYFVLECLAVGA